MNKRLQTIKYIVCDIIAAVIAWIGLFIFRKIAIENFLLSETCIFLNDPNFYLGLVVVPFFWIILYTLQGAYRNVYRKSRLQELGQTFFSSLIGIIFLFFVLLLDDKVNSGKDYYYSISSLFILQFTFTYFFRLILTSKTVRRIHHEKIGFNTLLVGSKDKALSIYYDIKNQEFSSGIKFIGYVTVNGNIHPEIAGLLPNKGHFTELKKIIEKEKVEEVVIAVENYEHDKIYQILTLLEGMNIVIKITPGTKDILLGSVKMTSIFDTPLILVNQALLQPWEKALKRAMDIVLSIIALIILSPVFAIIAIGVKLSSKGPVFYQQERIGYKGKPFQMYKFRSMYTDAEKGTPLLSSETDPRITHFGRFLRKVRLDEIPQFYSVLKGTMSLVGPRPERQYFIDQIVQRAPEYKVLHSIKPGITSWGQVKYGYAENVDEMIERLKYDLLYIENMSIATDIKILLHTAIIILQGRGK